MAIDQATEKLPKPASIGSTQMFDMAMDDLDGDAENLEGGAPELGTCTMEELLRSVPKSFGLRVGLVLCLGNACDALETLSGGFVLPQLKEEFGGDVTSLMAAVFFGMFCGGCCAGHAALYVGPTRLLVIMLATEALAGFGGATAMSRWQFALWRFVSGFAIGAAVPSLFTTANELIYPEGRRKRWLNLIASSFMIGTIVDAVLAWLMTELLRLSWRFYYASTGLLPMLACILAELWLPESPSFVLTHGLQWRWQRDLKKFGDLSHCLPTQDLAAMQLEAVATFELDDTKRTASRCSSTARLVAGRWRKSLLLFTIICFSIAFAWYGLSTWLLEIFKQAGVKDVYLAGIAFSISGLPGCIACISLIGCVDAQHLLTVALLSTAASTLLLGVILHDTALELPPLAAVATVCLFNSVSTGVFNVLTTVWACPFPIDLQPLAVGLLSVMMRIGSIVAQFVDGPLLRHQEGYAMLLITTLLLSISACASCCESFISRLVGTGVG